MLVCRLPLLYCTRDRGCSAHPAFPAPSNFRGAERFAKPRAHRVARSLAHGLLRRRQTRSARLTNFWHCGGPSFSFRTGPERRPGNEPSRVLAEDCASQGSGNADSQQNVRSSGGSGARRPSPGDSGCVTAHPASWRASASYRPLRAVWAFSPGHSGVARDHQIPSALASSAPAKGIFQ